jgi:hypothetical protein
LDQLFWRWTAESQLELHFLFITDEARHKFRLRCSPKKAERCQLPVNKTKFFRRLSWHESCINLLGGKLDFPTNVREYDMQNIISLGLFTALLASANVSAETRITPVYGSIHASGTECVVTGDQAPVSACNNRGALKQQKSTGNVPGESRQVNTQRVYLDDYQRIPQAVSKQHRTAPLLLGQNKESK